MSELGIAVSKPEEVNPDTPALFLRQSRTTSYA